MGYVKASYVSFPLLERSLDTAGSLSRLERLCFWTRRNWGKQVKIGMQDDNCIADILSKLGSFSGKKNGRVIAQRIGPFLRACLRFGSALDRACLD